MTYTSFPFARILPSIYGNMGNRKFLCQRRSTKEASEFSSWIARFIYITSTHITATLVSRSYVVAKELVPSPRWQRLWRRECGLVTMYTNLLRRGSIHRAHPVKHRSASGVNSLHTHILVPQVGENRKTYMSSIKVLEKIAVKACKTAQRK